MRNSCASEANGSPPLAYRMLGSPGWKISSRSSAREILLRVRGEGPTGGQDPETQREGKQRRRPAASPRHATDVSIHGVNGTTEKRI